MNDIITTSISLKNAKTFSWSLMYDKDERKPSIMIFNRPDDIKEEDFDIMVKAISSPQFWTEVTAGLLANKERADAGKVISSLIEKSIYDCAKSEAACAAISQ